MAAALSGSGSGPRHERTLVSAWWKEAAAHVGGGLLGGLVFGVVLAMIVAILDLNPWTRIVSALLLTCLAVVRSAPRFAPASGIGSHWQVPRGRRLRGWGRGAILLFWGALLGAGALTVIPHAAVLLLPALAIAAGSPLLAVIAGAVFGATRALLAVGTSRLTPDAYAALDLLKPLHRRLTTAGGVLAPVLGLVVVGTVVATWP